MTKGKAEILLAQIIRQARIFSEEEKEALLIDAIIGIVQKKADETASALLNIDLDLSDETLTSELYSRLMAANYNGPRNLDSVLSYTWEQKRGGPSG